MPQINILKNFFKNPIIYVERKGPGEFLIGFDFPSSRSSELTFLQTIFRRFKRDRYDFNFDISKLDGQFVIFQDLKTISFQRHDYEIIGIREEILKEEEGEQEDIHPEWEGGYQFNLELTREEILSIIMILRLMNYPVYDVLAEDLEWK